MDRRTFGKTGLAAATGGLLTAIFPDAAPAQQAAKPAPFNPNAGAPTAAPAFVPQTRIEPFNPSKAEIEAASRREPSSLTTGVTDARVLDRDVAIATGSGSIINKSGLGGLAGRAAAAGSMIHKSDTKKGIQNVLVQTIARDQASTAALIVAYLNKADVDKLDADLKSRNDIKILWVDIEGNDSFKFLEDVLQSDPKTRAGGARQADVYVKATPGSPFVYAAKDLDRVVAGFVAQQAPAGTPAVAAPVAPKHP